MTKGFTYILECKDGTYYTGSTKDLTLRLEEHQAGCGANYTKARLPVKLIYFEEFDRIDEAFYREKQIQRWSHKKKKALIEGDMDKLVALAKSRQAR
jgi:putative endonuclease